MDFDLGRAPYCAARDLFLRFSHTPGGMLELHLQNFQHLISDRVRNEQANFAGEGHLQQLLRPSTPQQCADISICVWCNGPQLQAAFFLAVLLNDRGYASLGPALLDGFLATKESISAMVR
jgi:hypothetical protein